jgi:hypothetical protein
MGNNQSSQEALKIPILQKKYSKILILRSQIGMAKLILAKNETDLKNELSINPPPSQEQIRNKLNIIQNNKKHIDELEKELNYLLTEKFTPLDLQYASQRDQEVYNRMREQGLPTDSRVQQREQDRRNQAQQRRQSFDNFTQVSNIPQNGHSQGCEMNKEDFVSFPTARDRIKNMINKSETMTTKDILMFQIEHNKQLIDDNLKQMNFLRQNPMIAQSPNVLNSLILPLNNQIMRSENTLKELYARLEQLNKEGFAQVDSPRLTNKKNCITSQELANARKMWGDALVAISLANDQKGLQAATQIAKQVIDGAYSYNLGPVLFKPTLTSGDHTFRTTRDGALSYFVGQNPKFPNDNGFALKGWRKADIETAAEFIDGDVAMWMGIVTLTDKNGNKVKVDKSWGYKKGSDGKLRIVLHHSSLPYLP